MSELTIDTAATDDSGANGTSAPVSVAQVFLTFLIIGSISFGGPLPYLRDFLVERRRWLDDKTFVELLSISQSLPGLNSTNMAILVGDKLAGAWGAIVAILGMCAPGAVLMFIAGIVYRIHGNHPWATSALSGVEAASVGLLLYTVVQLSQRSLKGRFDIAFVALTVLAINRFHVSVLVALVVLGAAAILWHRPKARA